MRIESITKDQSGSTAVEFGIILPVLILILFGIIELSIFLFNQQMITNASREGARAGIVARPDRFQEDDAVDVEAVVNDWADGVVTFGDTDLPDANVEILDNDTNSFKNIHSSISEPCILFECPLRVTVTYSHEFFVLSMLGFGPRTLSAQTTMRME